MPSLSTSFCFDPVSPDEVCRSLSRLCIWKARGLDNLSQLVLRECSSEIAVPLASIINLSLSSGVFPANWKLAVVQPVSKRKGDASSPHNYRPISLLSCVAKVCESFVKKQLLSYCLANDIIPDEQFGFLPKRSADWQLLLLLSDWYDALYSRHSVHALFLDVAKAFDRVDHKLLLLKLEAIGVRGATLDWFSSYLSGRQICTCVDGVTSEFSSISSGVPQGSILGPLLFVIYFRDLPAAVKSSCAMFADDSLVYDRNCSTSVMSGKPCCQLSQDIVGLECWSTTWNAVFNPTKSALLHIHRGRHAASAESHCALALNGIAVPSAKSVKHLGIMISADLTWSTHVQYLLGKVRFRVWMLKRLAYRGVRCPRLVSKLYTTLVRPMLEYGCAVWDNLSRHDSLLLEKVQLSVARAALRQSRYSSREAVLQELGLPTLAWRRRIRKLCLFWQLLHGGGPPALASLLPPAVGDRCGYNLRNKSIENPVCSPHSLYGRSFLPSSISLWNALPNDVTIAASASKFHSLACAHFSSSKFSFGL